MNISLILKIAELTGTVLGTLAFALVTYWRLREKRLVAQMGLQDNPERCGKNEVRLQSLEKKMDENHEDHIRFADQLQKLSIEIARLSRNGNGGQK